MGLYATTTSISNLVPQFLKGNTTTSDVPGTAAFSAHIDRAEGLINSKLVSRYALPFTTVPPLVRMLAEDIASFYALRGVIAQDGQVDNEQIKRFEPAIELLDSIAAGDTKLALTDGSLLSTRTTARMMSTTEDYAPTFNLDDPEDWELDDDRLDDIGDAR